MKKLCKIIGWALLAIEVLMVSAVAFIESTSGKLWLAGEINKLAYDRTTKSAVVVEGIEGRLPWDIRIASVRFRDASGEYAAIRNLHLSWNPAALVKKRFHIQMLEAEDISLTRLPDSTNTPPSKKPVSFSLPHLPKVMMDNLSVNTIHISAQAAGSDQILSLKGGGTLENYHVTLNTLEGPQTSLVLTLNLLPNSLHINALLDEAAGGVVLHFLKQPDNTALHLALNAVTDDKGIVKIDQAELAIGTALLLGSGNYAIDTQKVDAAFTLNAPDFTQFSGLAATALKGSADAHITLNGPLASLSTQTDMALHDFATGATNVSQGTLHAETVVDTENSTLKFNLKTDMLLNAVPVSLIVKGDAANPVIHISTLDATYGIYQAHAEGKADIKTQALDVSLHSTLPLLANWLPQLHTDGTAEATANINGHFDAFHLASDVTLSSRDFNGAIKAEGDIEPAKQNFTGELNGKFTRDDYHFTLHAPLKANASDIIVSDAFLKGDGISVKADMHWMIAQALGDGKVILDASDFKPLGTLLGQKLSGHATLKADATARGNKEFVKLNADAGDITVNGTTLNQAELTGTIGDAKSLNHIELQLNAGAVITGANRIESIVAQVSGGLSGRLAVKAETNGFASHYPFALKLDVDALRDEKDNNRAIITLKNFEGTYNASPIALDKPAHLNIAYGSFDLSSSTLKLAGGSITAKGMMTPSNVAANVDIHHLMLEKLPVANLPEGTLTADLALSGAPQSPEAVITGAMQLTSGEHPLITHAVLKWRKNNLTLRADSGIDDATLNADISATAPFSLSPFVIGIHGGTVVRGNVSLNAELEAFNAFLHSGGQEAGGHMSGNVKLAGTVGKPDVNGHITLTNGQYDYQDAGICLKNINASLSGNGEHVVLDSFKASSADNGILTASASLNLTGAKTLNGTVDFAHYRLFCGGVATGAVEGKLTVSGMLNAAKLGGSLTFPQMNVELPGNSAQRKIPVVKTVSVDPRTGLPKPETPSGQPGTGSSPLTLAVAVHVPNRMFVEGRGLNAEFSGDLNITGPATNPVIAGQFSSKRGSFELLDRKLKLTNAVLRFDGPIPPSPFLDVAAESVVGSTTIDVSLTGPAAKPTFVFTSTPALPQDEILSMLLFNRTLSDLGPFQVAQLAQATAELSGYSSGPGILGKVQNLLGVDSLNVGSDSGNSVNVGAGKYITDKIYVGVTQGAKPESRAVTTEIELHPHISATTGVTADGQQNLGVQWKYDY